MRPALAPAPLQSSNLPHHNRPAAPSLPNTPGPHPQPVIFVNGGINSHDFASDHVLHHTVGKPGDFGQQLRAYSEVTCAQVVVKHLEHAQQQIDFAITQALVRGTGAGADRSSRPPCHVVVCTCHGPAWTWP